MHPKDSEFIKKITEWTQSGDIKWTEESYQTDTFSLSGKNNTITVIRKYVSVLGEMEPCCHISMTISDIDNNQIEEITGTLLSQMDYQQQTDYDLLLNLFNAAKRSSRKIDEVMDSLLDEFNPSPF